MYLSTSTSIFTGKIFKYQYTMVLGKVLKFSTSTFQMYLSTSTNFGRFNPFVLWSRDWVVKLCVDIIVCDGSTLGIVTGKSKMEQIIKYSDIFEEIK